MRELHAIGLTPDGQHLVLAASPDATKGSHRIAVDQRFEAVLRGQRVDDPASGPSLSVQDMQARLRSGATVEEVAAAAGLPVSRVERFAGPVLSEREAVLRKVFAAHQVARRGRSQATLARAVAIGLEEVPNVKLDTVEWTAYRKADGTWVACVSVYARGRVRRAEWALDDANGTVRPLDAWSGSLGHSEGGPKPTKVAAVPAAALSRPPAKAVTAPAKAAKAVTAPAKAAKAVTAPARAAKAPARAAKAPAKALKAPARAVKPAVKATAPARAAKAPAKATAPARAAKATAPARAAKAPAKATAPARAAKATAPAKAVRVSVKAAKEPAKAATAPVKAGPTRTTRSAGGVRRAGS